MPASLILAAIVAALVGFGGTVALVASAAAAVGADAARAGSWIAALCLAIAATSAWLSWRHRIPVVTAWSTPGAALVAASSGVGLDAAVGAFLLSAGLVVLSAAFRPLGVLIGRIPTAVAAAMLAGVLFRFVAAVFERAADQPALVLPLVALFLLVRLASPAAAVLAVLAAGVPLAAGLGLAAPLPTDLALSALIWTTPAFDPAALLGLGLPLWLVTMAGQNLPGFAVLRAFGYPAPARPILAATGLASLAAAPFGGHATNLAAITAAICAGPEAHPDPARRWQGGLAYAACYLLLALFAASLVRLLAAMPPALIATVAGTALVTPLAGALGAALAAEPHRFAAVITLAVTASGLSLLGIGPAFWGLLAGLLVLGLERAKAGRRVG